MPLLLCKISQFALERMFFLPENDAHFLSNGFRDLEELRFNFWEEKSFIFFPICSLQYSNPEIIIRMQILFPSWMKIVQQNVQKLYLGGYKHRAMCFWMKSHESREFFAAKYRLKSANAEVSSLLFSSLVHKIQIIRGADTSFSTHFMKFMFDKAVHNFSCYL